MIELVTRRLDLKKQQARAPRKRSRNSFIVHRGFVHRRTRTRSWFLVPGSWSDTPTDDDKRRMTNLVVPERKAPCE